MLTQQTLQQLRSLRLHGMAEAYEQFLNQPSSQGLSRDEFLAQLVERELSARDTRRLKRLISDAHLPEFPLVEDADYRATRGLDRALMTTLAGGEWVRRRQNVLLVGATGTGKTWVGCALVGQMCRAGITALYLSAGDLFDGLQKAHADGTWTKYKRELIRVQILMIDDWGLAAIPPEWAAPLLDIIDKRSRSGSLVITSQYPLAKWHGMFHDPTIADALLDRIVHNSHQIQLKGESMRKLRAK